MRPSQGGRSSSSGDDLRGGGHVIAAHGTGHRGGRDGLHLNPGRHSWRLAMGPVKEAAARGRTGDDALRAAAREFFDRGCRLHHREGATRPGGVPSAGAGFVETVGDARPDEVASDVLLLMRAVNRPSTAASDGEEPDGSSRAAGAAGSLPQSFNAMLSELLAAQKMGLDAEVVTTLAAYYRSHLVDPSTRAPSRPLAAGVAANDSLRLLAQLLQEGGGHACASEVDALLSTLLPLISPVNAAALTAAIDRERAHQSAAAAADEVVDPAGAPTAGRGGLPRAPRRSDARRGRAGPEGPRETSRHALNALGALVSRSAPGAVTSAAHEAVGAALVALLDDVAGTSSGGPPPPEDPTSSRYFAAVTRCVHLCAVPERHAWSDAVIAGVVSHLRRFFRYGAGPSGIQSADQSADSTPPSVAASPSRGGYVPPHLRSNPGGGGSSDSDASDSEGRGGDAADRFGSSRVRVNAALCVVSLARGSPRSLHGHWAKLLPTSAAQLLPRHPSATLLRCVVLDPAPRVRTAAAAAVAQLLEGPASKRYLAAAEARVDAKTGRAVRRNFASLSSTLGDVATTLHDGLLRVVAAEPNLGCLPAACKALSAFVDAAPFSRLPPDLLPRAMLVVWKRLRDLPAAGGRAEAAGWGGGGAAAAGDITTARVSLLAALTATLSVKAASGDLTEALTPKTNESGDAGGAPLGASRSVDLSQLASLLPDLAAHSSAAGGFSAATRCEAYGALRAAAATHPAAVAATWREIDARGLLPAAACATSASTSVGLEESEGAADRLAQASAKLLADYLLAVGGAGVGGGEEEPAPGGATTAAGAAASTCSFLLPSPALASLWDEVARSHLPAMTAHASPLVRAAGLSALTGLTAAALEKVGEPLRRRLLEVALGMLKGDAMPTVRAAACRAIGTLSGVEGESLEPSVAALLDALKDTSKSVRLPASWAVANLCNTMAAAAANGGRPDPPIATPATVARLAKACVAAATQEGDKVRANAARALGHLVSAMRFDDAAAAAAAEQPSAWLPEVIQTLMSCLTTGNAKVQWNACHAIGALFRNPTTKAAGSSWSPLVMRMLLMLMRDTRNFKIRMHAAAALAVPGDRDEFGNAYPDTVSIVATALEGLDREGASEGGSGSGGGAAESESPAMLDLKYKPQLGSQLTTTLLRVLAMAQTDDAGALRETLMKKHALLRRALETAKAALEEAASLDEALPEDPFGVSAGAAKARAAETEGAGAGDANDHEDTAVCGSGPGGGDGSSPLRTSSLDMSSLAKALSPARSGGDSRDGRGDGDMEDSSGRYADVTAAAAGLARMYGALGAGVEEHAAFFRGMAGER